MLVSQEYMREAFSGENARPATLDDGEVQPSVSTRRIGYLYVKSSGEWLIALILLISSSPIMLFLAMLIRLTSHGPIVYAQTRLGLRGRRYRIYKFRTMIHEAEKETGPVWAASEDHRVTPLGRILRNTHLDELPQLWNVLCRDMSLIGPRPERPEIAVRIERHVSGFHNRLAVRPGITGLAQMLVPADDPDDGHFACARLKLYHDVYYVREVSFALDMRIALSTACFFARSAIDCIRRSVIRSHGLAVAEIVADDAEETTGQVA